jgi:tetratricopeptide (TPR) repeat protein
MEDALKSALIPMFALLVLNSCSWYRDVERSLVEDDEKKAQKSRSVSRSQYDQLLVKYEELSKKYEALKENPNKGQSSLVDELQKTSSENFAQTTPNAETVDAFPNQQVVVASEDLPSDLESQLMIFKKGVGLKESNPGEATKIFQQLESAGTPAIRVRAKLQIGELLYGKGQYDLALQVFEDIINKNAHSGVVLDALKYAVNCSDRLGIQNKKEQYASMLNDVFEAK